MKRVNCAKISEILKIARVLCLVLSCLLAGLAHGQEVFDGNQTGFPVFGSLHGSDLDSVSLSNGNLHIEIPIASFPERHGQFSYQFVYDTPSYTLNFYRDPVSGLYWDVNTVPGEVPGNNWKLTGPFGWGIGYVDDTISCSAGGVDYTNGLRHQYVLHDPSGTKHPLALSYTYVGPNQIRCPQAPSGDQITGLTLDGTGVWVQLTNAGMSSSQIILKDGTHVENGSWKDSNGNAASAEPSSDMLGRINLVQSAGPNGSLLWTVTDSNGNPQTFRVDYTNVSVTTNFCPLRTGLTDGSKPCSEYAQTWQVPSKLTLPDGLFYQFTWSTDGTLQRLDLPSGGSIAYTFGVALFNGQYSGGGCLKSNPNCVPTTTYATRQTVTSRAVTSNGAIATWNYSGYGSGGTTAVTDPLGNQQLHTFGCCAPPNSYETQVKYFQGSGSNGTLLKTVNKDYAFEPNPQLPIQTANLSPINVRVIRETTILANGLTKKTETDWETSTAACNGCNQSTYTATRLNPLNVREYDWGKGAAGPLLRSTSYTYLHASNSNYLNANIADLVTSTTINDGNSNQVAQTTTGYDETALAGTSGATNHDYTNFGSGNLLRGNPTTVSHWRNSDGALISTKHAYDDLGNVASTTDPNGDVTSFSYSDSWANASCVPSGVNTQAYVTQATNALGQKTQTTYFPCTGLKQAAKDQNDIIAGRAGTILTFDGMNRPVSTTFADGGSVTYDYSDNHSTATPLWASSSTLINAGTGLSTTRISVLDGLGRIQQHKLGVPTTQCSSGYTHQDFTYDAMGRSSTTSNPYCTTSDPTYGVTQTQYDALGRPIQVTKQDGSISLVQYNGNCVTSVDEAGKPRRTCSDALGRLVQVEEPSGTAGVSNPAFQHWGLPGDIPVPGDYDGDGKTDFAMWRPSTGEWWIIPSGGGGTIYRVWGHSGDVPVPGDYDGDGKTDIAIWRPSTGEWWIIRSSDGSLLYQTWGQSGDVPVPGDYDGDGKTDMAVWRPGTGVWWVTRSSDGVQYASQQWGVSGDIPVPGDYDGDKKTDLAVWRPSNGTWYVVYSSNGQQVVQPWGESGDIPVPGDFDGDKKNDYAIFRPSTTTWWVIRSSDGVSIEVNANADGIPVAGNYRSDGKTDFAVWQPGDGTWYVSLTYITQYGYDALGNLVSVVQQGDPTKAGVWRTRTFTYDSLSRLLTATNPESGTISYSYDADGNVLYRTSPAPNQTVSTVTTTTSFCYDKLNRVLAKGYSNPNPQQCSGDPPTLPNPAVTYTYDSGANGIGRLTSLTDQAGSGSYSYDALGRIANESRTIAGVQKNLAYTYNLDSSVATLTYPSGAVVTYTRDAAGRILSAIDSGNSINYVKNATYDATSALTGFLSGQSSGFAGITNSFSYNRRLQPLNMSATSPTATVFSIGYDFHLGNGDNGNVYAITNDRDTSRNQTFTYDALNRLASARNAGSDCSKTTANNLLAYWGNTYTYDPWGNLTNKAVMQNVNPPTCGGENLNVSVSANNQLVGYGYDAAGNMTYDPTAPAKTYSYDQENRITSAAGYTYTYDADGNRVEKSNGSTGTIYWYMSPGIVAESDLSGDLKSEYVFFNGRRVARKDLPSGAVSYYFSDLLGTASVITNSAGTIIADADHYPWGGELQFINNDSNHYRFTGKERDSETQLDYFGARYYGNALGRFITPDEPLADEDDEDPQSWNLYSYARNNPVTSVDADGRSALVCITTRNEGFDNYGEQCSLVNDDDYRKAREADEELGIETPRPGESGDIRCGGDTCGHVTYVPGSPAFMQRLGKDATIPLDVGPLAFVPGVAGLGRSLLSRTLTQAEKMAAVRAAGKAGEEAAGIVKNTERIPTKSGSFRVPDELNKAEKIVSEVKNVPGKLSYTSQLRDIVEWAGDNGCRMVLHVPESTTFTKPLQELINSGVIEVKRF